MSKYRFSVLQLSFCVYSQRLLYSALRLTQSYIIFLMSRESVDVCFQISREFVCVIFFYFRYQFRAVTSRRMCVLITTFSVCDIYHALQCSLQVSPKRLYNTAIWAVDTPIHYCSAKRGTEPQFGWKAWRGILHSSRNWFTTSDCMLTIILRLNTFVTDTK